MKNFIKQNLVLVMGLTLPVLLIVLFFVATVIPKALGTPPQYEMLFSTMRYDYQTPSDYVLDFAVKDQKLVVKARKSEDKNINYNTKMLMVYDGKTETVREITFDVAKTAESALGEPVVLAETKEMQIDTSSLSPDGYTLDGSNYSGGGLMMGMLGGGYHNSGFRLRKDSVGYQIPNTRNNYYYNQVQFIGWVVKK